MEAKKTGPLSLNDYRWYHWLLFWGACAELGIVVGCILCLVVSAVRHG